MDFHWTHTIILFQFGIIVYLYNDHFTSHIQISKTLEFQNNPVTQVSLNVDSSDSKHLEKNDARYPTPLKIDDLHGGFAKNVA